MEAKMKFRLKALMVLTMSLSSLTLIGCSSLSGWGPPQGVDEQKIALVDAWAARNNVTVIWVNQPRRAKPEVPPTPPTPAS
jgi:hypothetical protein